MFLETNEKLATLGRQGALKAIIISIWVESEFLPKWNACPTKRKAVMAVC